MVTGFTVLQLVVEILGMHTPCLGSDKLSRSLALTQVIRTEDTGDTREQKHTGGSQENCRRYAGALECR